MSRALRTASGFALCAAVAGVLWLCGAELADPLGGSAPLRSWSGDDAAWMRNRSEGWVYAVSEPFAAAASPGLTLRTRPDRGGQAPLQVRWRAFGEGNWHQRDFVLRLGRSYHFLALTGDPGWSGEVGEIAVRVLHRPAPEILSLGVESRGALGALRRAWAEARSVEIFGQTSINGLVGARAGGVALAGAAALALVVFVVASVRRAAPWPAFLLVLFALWTLLDLRFTADLAANAVADAHRFPRIGDADAVVRDAAPDFTALVDEVRRRVPLGARTAFLSDDPTYVVKAKYVFYPRPPGRFGRRARLLDNDFFVLFRDSGARFVAGTRSLRLRDDREVPVRPVAAVGDGSIYAVRKAGALRRWRQAPAPPDSSPRPLSRALTATAVCAFATWGLGALALAAVDRRRRLGVWCFTGAAYPAGAVLATSALLALGMVRLPLTLGGAAAVLLPVAALLVAAAWYGRRSGAVVSAARGRAPLAWTVWLGALLATKVAFVCFEILRRPLTAWDTFAVWGLRAKVWAERGALVLDRADPYHLGGGARPDYPPHVSLLQTWTALWLGDWNDVLVNTPWALYYASALLFAFGVLARRAPAPWPLLGVCALAGLPLFVVHAAVAGYADLVLSVHFLVAAAAVFLWAGEGGARVWLVVALLFTATLPYVKLEGVPLAAVCLLALAAQVAPARRAVAWVAAAAVVAAASSIAFANPMLRAYLASVHFHPEALRPIAAGLFAAGNWQLLWAAFALLAVFAWRQWWGTARAWLLFLVAAPMVSFLFVLSCTSAARFSVLRTADSRLFLSLAPLAVVFVVLTAAAAMSSSLAAAAAAGSRQGREEIRSAWGAG